MVRKRSGVPSGELSDTRRRSRRLRGDTRRNASSVNTPPRLATCLTAHPTNRVGACRSVRHSPPRPLPHLPIGAFFFVVFALADVPSARLTLSAYPPERSGVAEGELNAGRKSAAALSDLDTTDAIRPQSDPAISPRQIRRVEPTRHDYHSKLPQKREVMIYCST